VTPAEWRRSLQAIQGVVSEVLHGAAGVNDVPEKPVQLPAPCGAGALGVAAFTSGAGPLLGRWIEAGSVVAEEDVARLLLLHLAHGRLRAERLERAWAQVADVLQAADVKPTLIKGLHTARAFFPEPGTRPASDIDLVVEPRQIQDAERALLRAGFTRKPVLTRPYVCEWLPSGGASLPRSLELTHEANPWSVDVHASFERDVGGVRTVSAAPTWGAATRAATIAGRDALVLKEPYLTAYLAVHASQELKNLTLVRLIELVWVTRRGARDDTSYWDSLERLLEERRAAAYAYPALELAERLVPETLPTVFRAQLAHAAPPRVRRVVDRLEPATAQRLESVSIEEHFMWAVGPVDHLRRLWRVLWPSWAGAPAEVLRVQAGRARQLFTRRVSISDARPPRGA
jgi:hypothetical protein